MTRPALITVALLLTAAGLWAMHDTHAAMRGDDPHDWADYDAEDIA